MPETTITPEHVPFAGNPPGNQSSFLQALVGRKVYIRLLPGDTTPLVGILRGYDTATLTLEVKAHETSDTTFPMLVFKHAIASIAPD